jgi:hypothetical protein
MSQYKHYTPEMVDEIVRSCEEELDRREQSAFEERRLAELQRYIDLHPDEVANSPLVKALNAIPQRTQGTTPTAVQRTAPAPAPVSTGYKSRAQLEREKPWLRDPKTQLDSIVDPYCGKPGKPTPSARFGSPGIPPSGFWVL